jgi:hypothetical protein
MNRKSFLKSLLAIPFITLLDVKKIFAKDKQIFVPPNPFKLPFLFLNSCQITNIMDVTKINYMLEYEKIIPLIGINFLIVWYRPDIAIVSTPCMPMTDSVKTLVKLYDRKLISIETLLNGLKPPSIILRVVVSKNLDWWTPIRRDREGMYIIDEDVVKNVALHLTKIDQETIRNFLKNNKKEVKNV